MSSNSFSMFVNDFDLDDRRSKFCKGEDFDRLFVAIDAGSNRTREKYNRKKALNRQEWLRVLVNIGVMRYVLPGTLSDVSEALFRLLSVDLEPKLSPGIFVEPNVFRTPCAPASNAAHAGSAQADAHTAVRPQVHVH